MASTLLKYFGSTKKHSIVRIHSLIWADILVAYALFVMQNYLTDVWNLSLTHAAAILNFWNGLYRILPVFFLFFVDEYLGNFIMLIISSIAYTVGIAFVTMSTPPVLANSTGTCKEFEPQCIGQTQKALFYTGMALIAVGVASNLVSLKPFLEEQLPVPPQDDASASPKFRDLNCLQIVGLVIVVVVGIVGATVLQYIKPWTLRFGLPAICTAVGTILFLTGTGRYIIEGAKKDGSPITKVARVYVAATRNIFRPKPVDPDNSFSTTSCLECLHKAAIRRGEEKEEEDMEKNKWRECTKAEVEDAKIAVRMVPMWMAFIVCEIVSSIGDTYFIEQSKNLKRNIGTLTLPTQFLKLVKDQTGAIFTKIADLKIVNSKYNKAPSIGIAVAMVFSVLCCITAAKMEMKRLKVVRIHGLLDNSDDDIPMSIYWLLFQFMLLAGLDSFLEKSVAKFYKDQAPSSMTSTYLDCYVRGVSGLGFMCSSLSVFIVGKISERGGRPNWFQHTLNRSGLDRYYWVLTCLSSVNLFMFVFVSRRYRYKEPKDDQVVELPNACTGFTDRIEEPDQETRAPLSCDNVDVSSLSFLALIWVRHYITKTSVFQNYRSTRLNNYGFFENRRV